MLDMHRPINRLSAADRTRIVAALVEGNSIRATCRMTGAAKGTVLKLLADLGKPCAEYHDAHVRGSSPSGSSATRFGALLGRR